MNWNIGKYYRFYQKILTNNWEDLAEICESEHSVEVSTPKVIDKMYRMEANNRRRQVREIARTVQDFERCFSMNKKYGHITTLLRPKNILNKWLSMGILHQNMWRPSRPSRKL